MSAKEYLFRVLSTLPSAVRRPAARSLADVFILAYADLSVSGLEHIPDGPVLYVGNHLSNADGLVLNHVLRQNRPVFVAGVKLKMTAVTSVMLEAVDTIAVSPNTADLDALKKAVECLKGGRSLLIFPEGGRSRMGALIEGKGGAVVIAHKANVPIVPVALTGTEQLLPISDRDMGGEQLQRAKVTVTVGKPFSLADLGVTEPGPEGRKAQTGALMRRIAALLPPRYQGVYAESALVQQ